MANSHVDMFTAWSLDWRHYMDPHSLEAMRRFLFLPQLTPRPAANGTFPRPMICIQLWYSKWFPKPNVYHMNHMCFPCKSNCVRRNAFSKTASTHAHLYAGLRHHSFDKSLVGGIVGAKTNSHDLLARSSTWHQHPSQVEILLIDRADWTPPYREHLPTLPLESGYSSPNVLIIMWVNSLYQQDLGMNCFCMVLQL